MSLMALPSTLDCCQRCTGALGKSCRRTLRALTSEGSAKLAPDRLLSSEWLGVCLLRAWCLNDGHDACLLPAILVLASTCPLLQL